MSRTYGRLMTLEEALEKTKAAWQAQGEALNDEAAAVRVAPELEPYVGATHYAGGAREPLPSYVRSAVSRHFAERLGKDCFSILFELVFMGVVVALPLISIAFWYKPQMDTCPTFTAPASVLAALVCVLGLAMLATMVPGIRERMREEAEVLQRLTLYDHVPALYVLYAQHWLADDAAEGIAEPVAQVDLSECVSDMSSLRLLTRVVTAWSDGAVTCKEEEEVLY